MNLRLANTNTNRGKLRVTAISKTISATRQRASGCVD